MKSSILFLIFFSITLSSYSQNGKTNYINKEYLIGLWQIDDTIIGDVLNKNFRFYSNSTFILTEDEYDNLNRVITIRGTYRIDTSYLVLKVKNHDELVGGKLVPGYMGVQSQEFVIRGGEVKTIDDSDMDVANLWIRDCDMPFKSHNYKCLLLGPNKYYKISNNPDADK